jgi:hypothetical protein
MKVTQPLLSETASGSVGPFLTFSRRKSGQQCRYQKRQTNAASAGQAVQRAAFSKAQCACDLMEFGVLLFGVALFGNELALYRDAVQVKNITEKNQCISEYLLN